MSLVLLLFLFTPLVAHADNFKVIIDNQTFTFIQPAIQENEDIYIPIRTFFSILGAKVSWDAESSNIILSADNKEYFLKTDLTQNSIIVNENTVVPVKNISYQIYIPIDFASEILNYHLSWNSEENSLTISKITNTFSIFKNLPEVEKFKVIETITGIASWYGSKFHGRETTSGEIFDQNAFTAAHNTLPFDTYVRVTFLETNKSTIVRINDRGPHKAGRILDLSKKAAEEIGLKPFGIGKVKIEVLENYTE